MIITSRVEKFYKIEMTAAQADSLQRFLRAMQERHIQEIAKMAGDTNDRAIHETKESLFDLLHVLENR